MAILTAENVGGIEERRTPLFDRDHMDNEPATITPDQHGVEQGIDAAQIAAGEDMLRALRDRIDRLEVGMTELQRQAKTHEDGISRIEHSVQQRLTEIAFGNRTINVRSSQARSMEQKNMETYAAMLAQTPLAGAVSGHFRRHLLIPIHAPKLNYVSSMFNRMGNDAGQQAIRCTFIATTAAEREVIERYIQLTCPVMPVTYEVISSIDMAMALGMDDLANAMLSNRNGGIINMKKMISLYRALCEGAEEVCCIDADSAFISSIDAMFDKCGDNYRKKKFAAVSTNNDIAKSVVDFCSSYFSRNDEKILKNMYKNNLYSWFFDVPFFKRDDCLEFFEHIRYMYGGIEDSISRLCWNHFDHVLYLNYLILRGDFQLCDVSAFVTGQRLSDDLLLSDIKRIEEQTGLSPVWATLGALMAEQAENVGNGFYAVSHVDRLT